MEGCAGGRGEAKFGFEVNQVRFFPEGILTS